MCKVTRRKCTLSQLTEPHPRASWGLKAAGSSAWTCRQDTLSDLQLFTLFNLAVILTAGVVKTVVVNHNDSPSETDLWTSIYEVWKPPVPVWKLQCRCGTRHRARSSLRANRSASHTREARQAASLCLP